MNNTSIVENYRISATFYKDGGVPPGCPKILFSNSYNYDLTNPQNFDIIPDPYLLCSGVYFTVQ